MRDLRDLGALRDSRDKRDLRALPKVHVHVHLDGSYPEAAVRELARRRGAAFERPESFADEWSFFDAYGTVPALVETPDDLTALCRALVAAEAEEGVLFVEPAIEPQLYSPRLGSIARVTAVIVDALQAAGAESGIQVGANLTINTDQDEAIADELTDAAVAFAGRGVTALGTAGFVEPAGLGRFRRAALRASDAGLQVVAHAGQTGGPDSILEALDELGATRLSHGVRAVQSHDLLERLAGEGIVCDVCPVSNVALGVAPSLAEHPARAMVEAGVAVTLNADDSLWFGRSVTDQYAVARDVWGFDDETIGSIAAHGLLLPALTPATRSVYEDSLASWFTAAPG
jgi:adenosine deaminase